MNIQGVFLHVVADALGSVVVVITALVIWLTNWEYRWILFLGLIKEHSVKNCDVV